MPRSGLLTALLICASPVWPAPHVLIALDGRVEAARPLNAEPDMLVTKPQVPLIRGTVTPVQELCDAIGNGAFQDGVRLPVDPDQILSTLKSRGLCRDGAG